LTTKRDQLEKDKKQLYDTIEALDQKKKTELITAHKRISEVGSNFLYIVVFYCCC